MSELPPPPSDFTPSQESHHAIYQLSLDAYQGPLDLLLFLVRRHSLNIFDIPMAQVCRDYVACLAQMEGLSLDVAAEFMAMAAELVSIKARMLLPRPTAAADSRDDEEETDPRAALVARLLEHQKYKEAAANLDARPLLGRDVFAGVPVLGDPGGGPIAPVTAALRPARVFQLAQAFQEILRRQKQDGPHRVRVEASSVKERMRQLIDQMAAAPRLSFAGCVAGLQRRIDLIVTFLAILELTRMKLCALFEDADGPQPELWVQSAFASVDAALGAVSGAEEQFS